MQSASTVAEYLPLNQFAPLAGTNRTTLKQLVERGIITPSVAQFIAHLRRQETEPQPPEIKIINAKEVFSPAKILTVKRSDDGKLSGATIEPIS